VRGNVVAAVSVKLSAVEPFSVPFAFSDYFVVVPSLVAEAVSVSVSVPVPIPVPVAVAVTSKGAVAIFGTLSCPIAVAVAIPVSLMFVISFPFPVVVAIPLPTAASKRFLQLTSMTFFLRVRAVRVHLRPRPA
jgi:hypothetical protein